MAMTWAYLALLVSLTTLGVCFAVVDLKDVSIPVAHRIPVTKDSIPRSNGIAHRNLVTKDEIPVTPPHGTHWFPRPPPDDDNIHKDRMQPSDSIADGIRIPSRPPKHSTESNYVNDPPPGAGGSLGGGEYCHGDDCRIGMQPIYGKQPPSSPPLCQPTNPPPLCPPNPPSCSPYPPPCSQDCGWGYGAPSPQQPGGSTGKGMMMRPGKENAFYDDHTVKQLIDAMQELTKVIKKKAAP